MQIQDNFLPHHEFEQIQRLLMSSNFPWFFNTHTVYTDDNHNSFQFPHFSHLFYNAWHVQSNHFEHLQPFFKPLEVYSLQRLKANLLARTDKTFLNEFHVDEPTMASDKLEKFTTAIFYINTNNGYTEFADGTKVESVANRMVTFPSNIEHRGTSCTDEKARIVINFNYLKT